MSDTPQPMPAAYADGTTRQNHQWLTEGVAVLRAQVAALRAQVAALTARVEQLEADHKGE